jgi:hypothetical protein
MLPACFAHSGGVLLLPSCFAHPGGVLLLPSCFAHPDGVLLLPSCFAHLGMAYLLTACFALKGEVLFFAPPKKSTQKKGDPGGLPAARVPCASRKARRSRNSLRSNRRERPPAFTAMLGCARQGEIQNQHPEYANLYLFALTEGGRLG